MADEHDQNPSDPTQPGIPGSRLRQLLGELQHLVRRIGRILLEWRLERGRDASQTPARPDIAEPLGRHIDNLAVDSEDASNSSSRAASESVATEPMPVAADNKSAATKLSDAPSGMFGALGARLRKLRRGSAGSPHLADRLKDSARRHVVSALRLAREGKTDEARMRAGLAENAMKEASRYMGESEYEAFEQEVRDGLSDILAGR